MPKMKRAARWKGDAVEPAPDGQAEKAAERAEGHTPTSGARAAAPERLPARSRHQGAARKDGPGDADTDEKTAEAAEEHRERASSDARPARGKL
jgi:hypothetical protein